MSQFITFNTVIGNGKSYQVPIFQRDYSWEKDDWEDLQRFSVWIFNNLKSIIS